MRPSEQNTGNDNHQDRSHLQAGQQHLDGSTQTHAQIIDCGDGQHHQGGQRLRGSESKFLISQVAREQGGAHDGENESQESEESCCQSGHGYRPLEKRTHPAQEKPPERTEARVQIDVRASGFRECRAQFGIAESAEQHDETTRNPGREHQGG